MKTKDGRDLPVLEITADNYIVPQGEEMHVHAKIEVTQFDPKTGRRISRPVIQKFGMKEWQSGVNSSLRKQGYTIEILHDPYKWVSENRAKMEAEQAAKAQAAREAQAAQAAQERAALKAELMAEIKAEMAAQAQEQAAKAQAAQAQAEQAQAKGPGRPPKEKE